MRALKTICLTLLELLKIVSPVFVAFAVFVLWTIIPEIGQNILVAGALVAIAALFGCWAWGILGTSDEGYPFGRAGRFMHLLVAFGVIGFIAVGLLAWVR